MKIYEFVIIGTGMGGRVAYAPGDPGRKILLLERRGLLSGILKGRFRRSKFLSQAVSRSGSLLHLIP